jgi:hypothetical protein
MSKKTLTLVIICLLLCFASTALAETMKEAHTSRGADPNELKFFIYMLDIDDIDGAAQNFAANVFIRLSWKDDRLALAGAGKRFLPVAEVWHPIIFIANQFGVIRPSLPEMVEIDSEGNVYYSQRYVGRFSQPLRLSEFPFDDHQFTVQFVIVRQDEDSLKLTPITEIRGVPVKGGEIATELSLPDWEITSYESKVQPIQIGKTGFKSAGFAFVFTAKRYFTFYLWQVIIPMALVVMMSWAAFWVDPSESGAQLGLAASSMLTLIAHRIIVASLIPKLPYMTRMDYFSVGGTVMVFMALVEVVITSIMAHHGHVEHAKKVDRISRILFPIMMITIFALAFFRDVQGD